MTTRKSLVYSFLDRYAALLISIFSSMVIARLLTPEEIGVFSVTMVLLAFASSVRDLGAGSYLVQERELTTERIRAVWAIQLGLGVLLALTVLLASFPIASFYNEPRMRDIMLVIALNYAINPFGSLTYAWLMREMRFNDVALMRFSAALGGALVSVWMAWEEYGPISLAFGSLASTSANALMSFFYRPKSFPWVPGIGEIKRVISFGSKLSFSDIIAVFVGGSPDMFLGKIQGLTSAGLYSRANGLVQMFYRLVIDAVGSVCLPWFAKQSREEGKITDPFLNATAYVSVVGWFFCSVLICQAYSIVRILYGSQWDDSVDLVRILALATAIGVPASLCHVALLSIGAVSTIARLTVLGALVTVPLVALAAFHSAIAVSFSAVLISIIMTSSSLWITSNQIGLPLVSLARALLKSAKVTLVSAIGPIVALSVFGATPENYFFTLIFGCCVGTVGLVGGAYLFKHPLRKEIGLIWLKIRSML